MSPLQNRVRPDGELVAISARGTLLGNRGGRIHDPVTKTLLGRRRWSSHSWISCELEFKGRRDEPWGAGYTHLFFLDEITALAAGHRPCHECRRHDARAFAAAVAAHDGLDGPPRAPVLDRRLHPERLDGRSGRRHGRRWEQLPAGAVVAHEGGFAAIHGTRLLRWTFTGYEPAGDRPPSGPVEVLTPPTVLAALAAGYVPRWHRTADTLVHG